MDQNSMGTGFMAVFAVSGSVVLLSLQVHKRLLSNFMKKMEFELGMGKGQEKKKVRFADEVGRIDNKESDMKREPNKVTSRVASPMAVSEKIMPLNWQILYKGMLDYRKSTNCK